MDRKKLTSFLITAFLCTGIFSSISLSEVIIIIEPDPIIDILEPVAASVDVTPDELNLKLRRSFVTAYIELPTGFDVNNIQADTVKITSINGQNLTSPIPATGTPVIGDYDSDQFPDIAFNFDYAALKPQLPLGEVTIGIAGAFPDTRRVLGGDTISVISQDVIITAVVDVDPTTINLKAAPVPVTASIELPAGYDINAILPDSIKIVSVNGQAVTPVPALASPVTAGDKDGDQVPDLTVSFDYTAARPLLAEGMATIGITGELAGGEIFTGQDTISIINRDENTTLTATVQLDPGTLNLKSNRNYITAYIELPSGYSARDIKADSVKITAINHRAVTAISPAHHSPTSIDDEDHDGISELMVKFDYGDVEHLLASGTTTVEISGTLNSGKKFAGEDTIKVIHDNEDQQGNGHDNGHDNGHRYGHHYGHFNGHRDDDDGGCIGNGGSRERTYHFSLGKHIAKGALIKRILLWEKSQSRRWQNSDDWEAWHYKSLKQWQAVPGKFSNLNYSNMKKGSGYEWNLTEPVNGDWQEGVSEVVVKLDEDSVYKHPVLVVTYDQPAASGVTEDTAVVEEQTKEKAKKTQELKPIGESITLAQPAATADDVLTLSYNDSELRDVNEKDLGVYYWDKSAGKWQMAPDSSINKEEHSITCRPRYGTSYQVMAPKQMVPASGNPAPPAVNSLKQNYPNPFNAATTIEYSIAQDCQVSIKLYNVAGELVATVVDEYQTAGSHSVQYAGGPQLSRGVYYYQLVAGSFVETRRMVVLR